MSSFGYWKTIEACIQAIEENAEALGRCRALHDHEDTMHHADELDCAKRTLLVLAGLPDPKYAKREV